ncbi:hypothetical protein [Azospirillum brasilense]|uniref:hypothetical protein n=1 Tax=Azospirillum brasilense TaxID=192 RepID=UPI00131C95E5|nr:hypothetical protein [Azospirillum brasilense]MDW7629005.1 hypothetical protein [Azospirillum brasilense]
MHTNLAEAYPGFIGPDAAERETRTRSRNLLTDTAPHLQSKRGRKRERRRAAEKLNACLDGSTSCKSPSCLKCTRQLQVTAYDRLSAQFADHPPLHHVTLVHDRYMVEAGELDGARPQRVINTVRQQFKRAALLHGKAVGSYEVEFRTDLRCWVPHTHLIVAGLNRKEIERLRRWYASQTTSGSHRMVVQEIENTPEDFAKAFTYPFKWRTYGRDVVLLPDGSKTRGRAYRLPKPIEDELLLFLNAHKFENLIYTINFGSRGAFWKASEHSQMSGKAEVPPSTGWSTYTPVGVGTAAEDQPQAPEVWTAETETHLKI